jgi:hypothetical protein
VTTLVWTYAAYLAVSGGVTVLVGGTLHRHGRAFLIDVFGGSGRAADAVNHLLLVGFYLTNLAFVTLTLKSGLTPEGLLGAAELLSGKIGVVLFTLGVMHFFNLAVLTAVRRRAVRSHRPVS